ncbi:maltose acetyltransferase domain-containing protein [Bacillus sp. FSL K6-3431]|uniref:maltose acetyltransferase domain-containing protein n=1 Tax=Bacillus sp. FSL K6-3431 TaxID=2921500 RepID=UPI0030FA7252
MKSEKENVKSRTLYKLGQRERAKDLLFEFNNIKPSKLYERNQIIQKIFHSLGENAWIESPFNCDFGYNITFGDNFYANTNCTILDCAKVTIGNNVLRLVQMLVCIHQIMQLMQMSVK